MFRFLFRLLLYYFAKVFDAHSQRLNIRMRARTHAQTPILLCWWALFENCNNSFIASFIIYYCSIYYLCAVRSMSNATSNSCTNATQQQEKKKTICWQKRQPSESKHTHTHTFSRWSHKASIISYYFSLVWRYVCECDDCEYEWEEI